MQGCTLEVNYQNRSSEKGWDEGWFYSKFSHFIKTFTSCACTQWARTGAHCLPHTCGLLNVGQSPHGEFLSMVRLARVTRSWPDALIPEFAQVCNIQLLTTAVSPQFSANSLMELLCKSLGTQKREGHNQAEATCDLHTEPLSPPGHSQKNCTFISCPETQWCPQQSSEVPYSAI